MLEAGLVITLASRRYRLDAPLAGSAYGLVWRAATLPAGAPVVLKFVNQERMAQAPADQRERWIAGARAEADFLGSLAPWDGRHIVRPLDRGEYEGLPVLALELLDNDLGTAMARRRAVGSHGSPGDIRWSLRAIAQVNQALAKVHQYGRRHLDLKPANLLLAEGGAVLKLTDFGTSRAIEDSAPHEYAGTPNWQAPEQIFAATGDAASAPAYRTCAATDYFALGALLFYLVTGGTPLRFCSQAVKAWRAGQAGAAAAMRRLHGGAMPLTLHDDEAALFVRLCDAALPAQRGSAGERALDLLASLLAFDPDARPAHALAISRMLAAIDGGPAMPGAGTIATGVDQRWAA